MTRAGRLSGVAGASLAVLALQQWASIRIGGPSVAFDETGYLGNARWIAGVGAGWEMPTAPTYAVGYPLVIAPIVRVFSDPHQQWRAILVVNGILLAALVPLLYLVGRRVLGASHRIALAAAVVGAVVPAAFSADITATAENLALPLVPAVVLLLHHALGDQRGFTRWLLGPAVALLVATHSRFMGLALVTVAILLLATWRRLIAPRVAMAHLGLLALGLAAQEVLTKAIVDARWDHIETIQSADDLLRLGRSVAGWSELAKEAVGQAWYLAAGSLGLSVVGIVAIVGWIRGSTPGGEPVPPEDREPTRWVLAFTLASAATLFVTSVAFFADAQFRPDHLVYGRHNDSFTPLWVAAGTVALQLATRRLAARLLAVATVVTVGLFAILASERDPASFGGRYSPFGAAAIIRAVEPASDLYWRATGAAVIALVVMAVTAIALRRPRLAAAAASVWFFWVGLGIVTGGDTYDDVVYEGWRIPEEVTRLGIPGMTVDVRAVELAWPTLTYAFHLPDVRVETFDPGLGDEPGEPFVVARTDDGERQAEGSRIVLIDSSWFIAERLPEGLAIWVRPGPEQDRLAAEGRLLPADFPAILPAAAQRAEVGLTDLEPGATIHVPPGGRARVGVQVRHAGSGSPWPNWPNGRDSGVRVIARITEIGGDGEGFGAQGVLGRWMLPGDQVDTSVELLALDPQWKPLAPGRYRVDLGVGQIDPSWFSTDPSASLTLVVDEP